MSDESAKEAFRLESLRTSLPSRWVPEAYVFPTEQVDPLECRVIFAHAN